MPRVVATLIPNLYDSVFGSELHETHARELSEMFVKVICAAPFKRTGQFPTYYFFTQGIDRSVSETSFPRPKLIFSKGAV